MTHLAVLVLLFLLVPACSPHGVVGPFSLDGDSDIPNDLPSTSDATLDSNIPNDLPSTSDATLDAMDVTSTEASTTCRTSADCPTGASCVDGRCAMRTCTPGARECVDATRARTCRADGLGFDAPAACPTGQTCAAGACSARVCTPGAPAACADAVSTRTCAPDGMGYQTGTCPARPNAPAACVTDRCALVCQSGYGNCDAVEGNGCEASLATSTSNCGACGRSCGFSQVCRAGSCVTSGVGMCPPSCVAASDCDPCATPGDPGNYCCISGLCLYMTGMCTALPDGGVVMDTGMINTDASADVLDVGTGG